MSRETHPSGRSIDRRTLMERSIPGRVGSNLPALDVPHQPLPPPHMLRDDLQFPEISEPELVRYFTNLSRLNFSIDTNFYPLGSCTMKYNPKLNEEMAFMPGFAAPHPRQTADQAQGCLKLLFLLQGYLAEITGMKAASLAPLAGAQGELCGMLMIRAFHQSKGDAPRRVVAIPDSAHGTNPASAAMAGFEVVSVASDPQGNIDLKGMNELASDHLAGVMITQPNTLGLFDGNISELCEMVHRAGGLVYGDGANMNALLGRAKLGHMGFDVVHLNLHKTFSTPHGGGGPGSGPVCVSDALLDFLPSPVAVKSTVDGTDAFTLESPPESIGKVGGFHGNFGMLVRAYTYIRTLGASGLKQISADAVVNANYLLESLKDTYHLPYDRRCMHEVILSAKDQKARGVKGIDIAKRLLDYGFHSPTMYFPLIVEEALMIEPTEAESKESLDAFIDVMKAIDQEVTDTPELVTNAPQTTPVTRLDEAKAARQPDLRG